jgi:hypothetical protein
MKPRRIAVEVVGNDNQANRTAGGLTSWFNAVKPLPRMGSSEHEKEEMTIMALRDLIPWSSGSRDLSAHRAMSPIRSSRFTAR